MQISSSSSYLPNKLDSCSFVPRKSFGKSVVFSEPVGFAMNTSLSFKPATAKQYYMAEARKRSRMALRAMLIARIVGPKCRASGDESALQSYLSFYDFQIFAQQVDVISDVTPFTLLLH